jgi:hypothetical protein
LTKKIEKLKSKWLGKFLDKLSERDQEVIEKINAAPDRSHSIMDVWPK